MSFMNTLLAIMITLIGYNSVSIFILNEKKEESLKEYFIRILKDKKELVLQLIIFTIEAILINLIGVSAYSILNMILVFILYRIAIIDYETKLVDNKLLYMLYFVAGLSLVVEKDAHIIDCLITGVITTIVLLLVAKFSKGAVGYGDAKVIGALAFIYGFGALLAVMTVSSILVAVFSAIILFKSFSKNRKKEIPFTPFVFVAIILLFFITNR